MPNILDASSGSPVLQPAVNAANADLERAKFVVNNGTVAVAIAAQGTVIGTAQGLPVTLQTLLGGEDLTNNVQGQNFKPVNSNTYSPSEFTSFGAVVGTVVKAAAGNVYGVDVTSGTNAIRYFQLFNAVAVPAVGGTPVASYPLGSVSAGGISRLQLGMNNLTPSQYFSTGISWAISSTGGTYGTANITASDHFVHIKYV